MCYLRLHRIVRIGLKYFNLPIEVIWREFYTNVIPLATKNLVPWDLKDAELILWLKNNGAFKNI